jgi:hypothetical protein
MTGVMASYEAIETILREWAQITAAPTNVTAETIESMLPSASQLYQVGLALYWLTLEPASSDVTQEDFGVDVSAALKALIDLAPRDYAYEVLGDLKQALLYVAETSDATDDGDLQNGCRSMIGIYQIGLEAVDGQRWTSDELSTLLSETVRGEKTWIPLCLQLVNVLIWGENIDQEQLLPIIHTLKELGAWYSLIGLHSAKHPDWKKELLSRYSDATERKYVVSLLEADDGDGEPVRLSLETHDKVKQGLGISKNGSAKLSPEEALQRRIGQVREVMPELGEGFIESVLSYYKGNVEQSLAVLLDTSLLPAQLQILDQSLPRRHRKQITSNEEQDARETTKAALQAIQLREEEEALAVDRVMGSGNDEYDDDYDDQYDALDGVGGADSGLYDDYDAILTYNRILKQVEGEQGFWEETRNTNRATHNDPKKSNVDGKVYRGQDKSKGGKIPVAGRGGKLGSQLETANADGGEHDEGTKGNSTSTDNKPISRRGQKHKSQKLAKRREKQKQSSATRSE